MLRNFIIRPLTEGENLTFVVGSIFKEQGVFPIQILREGANSEFKAFKSQMFKDYNIKIKYILVYFDTLTGEA